MEPPTTPLPPTPTDMLPTPEPRKRQPRNSACQACSALKMKCVFSAEGGKCQRCNRMKKECLPAVPKARRRKTESNDSSIASSSIRAFNLNSTTIIPRSDVAPTSIPQSTPRQPVYEAALSRESLLTRSDIRHNGSKSFTTLFSEGLSMVDVPEGIDYNYVQNTFVLFRRFATHFPFIDTFTGADAVFMAAERPMTTAAICVVTATADTGMQHSFSHMFRMALAMKVIVEGQRSLDLMVGLLIYLAWHHHCLLKQQIYQHLCLLAGMATDSGIYQSPLPRRNDSPEVGLERDRTLLGCYYLCSTLSRKGFNHPNPLPWSHNLRLIADRIYQSDDAPHQPTFASLIELAHIVDDLNEAVYHDPDLKRSTAEYAIEMHAKAANQRLKSLRREYLMLGSCPSFVAATVDVHYKLLSANDAPDTSTLIQYACAIKEYLDDILARPAMTLHQISIVDWSDLLAVLVQTATISRPPPNNAGWEWGALSSMLQPDRIFDSLCNHMASVPHGDALAPRNEPLMQALRVFCEDVKRNVGLGEGRSGAVLDMLDRGMLAAFVRAG